MLPPSVTLQIRAHAMPGDVKPGFSGGGGPRFAAELRLHRRGSGRLLNRKAPVLPVTDPCIWHGCGTNLNRRQSATMAGPPTDQARVCLAAHPSALATLPVPSTREGQDGRHMMTLPEPSAWEARVPDEREGC